MTQTLGWLPDTLESVPDIGIGLEPHGALLRVLDEACPDKSQRLRRLQTCYRVFPVFLPCLSGGEDLSEDEIRHRMERVGRHGQLRLQLDAPARPAVSNCDSGRAYLNAKRCHEAQMKLWSEHAKAALLLLARHCSQRAVRLSQRAGRVTVDALVSNDREATLEATLQAALTGSRAPGLHTGRLTVSGLWAPVAFSHGEAFANG